MYHIPHGKTLRELFEKSGRRMTERNMSFMLKNGKVVYLAGEGLYEPLDYLHTYLHKRLDIGDVGIVKNVYIDEAGYYFLDNLLRGY